MPLTLRQAQRDSVTGLYAASPLLVPCLPAQTGQRFGRQAAVRAFRCNPSRASCLNFFPWTRDKSRLCAPAPKLFTGTPANS
ncbi:MAG TPA: hypothetical protein VI112_06125 [Bacteroidia bacterium]